MELGEEVGREWIEEELWRCEAREARRAFFTS
jgi:hypothetical protein